MRVEADNAKMRFLGFSRYIDQLGNYWKDTNIGKHPIHEETNEKADRSVSVKMSQEILEKWGYTYSHRIR